MNKIPIKIRLISNFQFFVMNVKRKWDFELEIFFHLELQKIIKIYEFLNKTDKTVE